MAYIYKITNDINQKVYIGMTHRSIEIRWKEHQKDLYRTNFEHRPLYSAIKKYGIEHFHIELIEETDNPEERERFWIEQYRSFKNGYNATIGGDGKKYLDYDVLIAAYKEKQNLAEVSKIYGCDTRHLSQILKSNNIQIKTSEEVNQKKFGHIINQYDKNNNYIKSFPSAGQALKEVSPNTTSHGGISHIMDVCKGKRKTAYGYIWRFAE